MVLAEITKIFEKRKMELYQLLNERKEELKPDVQHQMYGAMNEIDIFLNTVEHYRQKEVDDEIKRLRLVGPMIREGKVSKFFSNVSENLSNFRKK
ncbi:hypothetical protein BVX95_00890 [archaeon D22]|nr:hypothetical protein BVX95_00890 [archaeon D22]